MTGSSDNNSPLLLHVETRGFSLIMVLLFLIGVGVAVVQVERLMAAPQEDSSPLMQYVYGGAALLIGAFAIYQMRRKGHFSVFGDRVEGKRKNGLAFAVAIDAIGEVELMNHAVALKGADGKELLLISERLPGKRDGGTVWLLKAYKDWPMPIWERYAKADGAQFPAATRQFLGENGQANFGDRGFLVNCDGVEWYFPESPTVDIIGLGAGQLRPNQRARSGEETRIQFLPSPDLIPLAKFCAALVASALPAEQLADCLALLAENHGGNTLDPGSDDAMTGECTGYRVEIQVMAAE